jgi:hypothetical protein
MYVLLIDCNWRGRKLTKIEYMLEVVFSESRAVRDATSHRVLGKVLVQINTGSEYCTYNGLLHEQICGRKGERRFTVSRLRLRIILRALWQRQRGAKKCENTEYF